MRKRVKFWRNKELRRPKFAWPPSTITNRRTLWPKCMPRNNLRPKCFHSLALPLQHICCAISLQLSLLLQTTTKCTRGACRWRDLNLSSNCRISSVRSIRTWSSKRTNLCFQVLIINSASVSLTPQINCFKTRLKPLAARQRLWFKNYSHTLLRLLPRIKEISRYLCWETRRILRFRFNG